MQINNAPLFDRCITTLMSLGVVTSLVVLGVTGTLIAQESIVTLEVRAKQGVDPLPRTFSTGVPFPKGVVPTVDRLLVHLDGGQALPFQFDRLARWNDGTVRWALLSAVVPRSPENGTTRLVVSNASRIATKESAEIETREDGVQVVVRGEFTLQINRLGLPDAIVDHVNKDVGEAQDYVSLLTSGTKLVIDEQPISAAEAQLEDVRVEENGTVRCVIRTKGTVNIADGKIADGRTFTYLARNTIFRTGRVATDYTIINHQKTPIESYGIVSQLPGYERIRMGGEVHDLSGHEVGILQHSTTYARFRRGGREEENRRVNESGEMELTVANRSVRVRLHDFWQRHPSSIAATDESMALWFWPPGSGPLEFYKVGRAARGSFTIAWGNESAADSDALYAVAPAEWYRDTKVFGRYSLEQFPIDSYWSYDLHLAALLKKLRLRKFRLDEFGFWDFGDMSKGPRGTERSWLNNEFGVAWSLLFHFLRTGNQHFFEEGVNFAKHFRDVDTFHYGPEAGKPVRHTLNHVVGDDYDVAHQWTEGMLLHYLLTGDRRSLEVCLALGDVLVPWAIETGQRLGKKPRTIDMTERDLGWGLLSLMALSAVSDDEKYESAAAQLVSGIVASQDQERGMWPRLMKHPKFEIGGATFMIGVLLEALQRFHEDSGDPAMAASLTKATYWLSNEMWHPDDNNFRYKQLPNMYDHYNDGRTIPMVLPGLVYVYHLGRRDPEYKQIVLHTIERYRGLFENLDENGEGANFKSLCMLSRAMPRVIYYYYESGLGEPEK